MAKNSNRILLGKVKGSGSKWYNVSYVPAESQYQCSCPAWTHKTPRQPCKHINLSLSPSLLGQSGENTVFLTPEGKEFRQKVQALLNESM